MVDQTSFPAWASAEVNPDTYYVYDETLPDKYYATNVNYYAPLDSENDILMTGSETDSDSDDDTGEDSRGFQLLIH